ncbi:DUF4834 family protein [Chitinophagaceae bacterium LB-8]|uniref:DUF4834 family protein n=1 Tax=Paraflavisolibacter caeni TaxID=2982496 RepID=A0A9X2XY28_9BACT|nr:DUF4834 family protein [Paraflavisolibacter caeni]MCU7550697.1 DUF4834 family protein [Paraflavisolibacter caeni]
MSVFSILFYGFLIYLLYRLVFNFIIPIYRTTRQVKKSFRAMHEQMNQHQHQQQGNGSDTQTQQQNKGKDLNTDNVGEYIDFEEIK